MLLALPDAVIAHVNHVPVYQRQVNQTLNACAVAPFCDPYYGDWSEDGRQWHVQFRTLYRFIILFASDESINFGAPERLK